MPVGAIGQQLLPLRLRGPAAVQKIRESIAAHGQLSSVVAFATATGVELIDGFKRVEAAEALGLGTLRVRVVEATPAQAKVSIAILNTHQSLDEIEEAWLVRALYREDDLSQPAIAQLFGRHKSWVCRRLALAESLDESTEADLRLGVLNASSARELARLPRGNQRAAADVVIRRGLTSHQTAQLVRSVLELAEDQRAAFLSAALDHGPPSLQPETQRRVRTPAELVLADVGALCGISGRLQARLHQQPLHALGDASSLILDALNSLHPVLLALARTVDRATQVNRHAKMDNPRRPDPLRSPPEP